MKVIEINNCDLMGQAFNGYDLHCKLRNLGYDSSMLVVEKYSENDYVECLDVDLYERERISYIEKKHSLSNVFFPYASLLKENKNYLKADIVHYHFLYHNMFSILDYSEIMDYRSVWTIHDLWIITGNCINPPKDCKKWRSRCDACTHYNNEYFPMLEDNTSTMWEIKKRCLEKINPHIIVSSEYLKRFIEESPITRHFTNIHVIPFGIDFSVFHRKNTEKKRDDFVIGFRAEDDHAKGCDLLYDALVQLNTKKHVRLSCVGNGIIPDAICDRFDVNNHGWVSNRVELASFYNECDVFVVPSRQETFCLMAIEAMASGCLVICFKDTVVEEIVGAPNYAMAADFENAIDLAKKIEYVIENDSFRRNMVEKCTSYVRKYDVNKYVDSHIDLFKSIIKHVGTCHS